MESEQDSFKTRTIKHVTIIAEFVYSLYCCSLFLKSSEIIKLFQEWRRNDCTKEAYDDILNHLEDWNDPKKFQGKLIE